MAKKHRLSVEDRVRVVCDYKRLNNYSQVAKLHRISTEAVRKIIKKSKECLTLADKPRSGRPKVTNYKDDQYLVRLCKRIPTITVRELQEQLKLAGPSVSRTTIRRRLHDAHFRGRVARKKPFLSKKHIQARLKFAREYEKKTIDFWKNVIFSDESKFELFGNRRQQIIWRRDGDNPYRQKYLKPTVKHGGGNVMVWGCCSWYGTGELQIIEDKMTSQTYCEILRKNLQKSADAMGLGRDFIFQQDNDPKHCAKITKQYLRKNKIKTLKWPSMSPDLNPIEHLWDELDRQIPVCSRKNINTFKSAILETWSKISLNTLQKLVESMPRRLSAVLHNKGGHTPY